MHGELQNAILASATQIVQLRMERWCPFLCPHASKPGCQPGHDGSCLLGERHNDATSLHKCRAHYAEFACIEPPQSNAGIGRCFLNQCMALSTLGCSDFKVVRCPLSSRHKGLYRIFTHDDSSSEKPKARIHYSHVDVLLNQLRGSLSAVRHQHCTRQRRSRRYTAKSRF